MVTSQSKTLGTSLPAFSITAQHLLVRWSSMRTATDFVTSAARRELSSHWLSSSAEGCRLPRRIR
jgi:hypothetical protein